MRSCLALALLLSAAWTSAAPARLSGALRMTLGLGVCGTLAAVLALITQLHLLPWALALLGAPTIVAMVRGVRRGFFALRSCPRMSLATPVGILVISGAVVSGAPVVEGDSVAYHMPVLRSILSHDGLRFWPSLWRSAFPQTQELLAAGVPLLGGDRPGLLSGAEFAIAAALIVRLGKQWLGDDASAHFSATIGLAGLAPLSLACSLKPDLLLLDAVLAFAVVLGALDDRSWRDPVVAGGFAGLMAGCKYSGVPMATLAMALLVWRMRRAAPIGLALIAFVGLGGFWYARNIVVLGNPMPPFLSSYLSCPLSPGAVRDFEDHRRQFGVGGTAWDALITPIRLLSSPEYFGGIGNVPNPMSLLGLVAPIALAQRRRALGVVVCAGVFYVIWFLSLQNPRLLLPASVLLGVLAAGVVQSMARRSRWLYRAAVAACVGPALLSAAFALARTGPAYLDPAGYLAARTPFYQDVLWMNGHLDAPGARIASAAGPLGYLDVPGLSLDPFVQAEIPPEDLGDAHRLDAALARAGVTDVFGSAEVLDTDVWSLVRARARVAYDNASSCLCGVHVLRPDPHLETRVLTLSPAP